MEIQKIEKQAWSKMVKIINTLPKAKQKELYDYIAEWSDLVIELEQRCNQ